MSEVAPNPKRSKKPITIALAAVICLVVAGKITLNLLFPRFPPGHVTGDPLDIRLTGVWPTTSTIVYDAAGNRIGETLGSHMWPSPTSHITPEYKSRGRNFIFEVHCGDEITFDPFLSIALSGKRTDSWASGAGHHKLCSQPGPRRFYVYSSFMSDYYYELPGQRLFLRRILGKPLGWWTPVTSVDLKLRYFYGPPGKAQQVFNGPFTPGQVYAAPGDPGSVLYVSEWYGFTGAWGTRIAYEASEPADYRSRIIVYDRNGKRLVCAGTSFNPKSAASKGFVLKGISPEDVALVTIGEQPKEKVFHNVRVAYEDECDVPPHLTEILRRLGIEQDSSRDYSRRAFNTPEQALAVLDVVRGPHIRNAIDILHKYDSPGAFGRLPQEDRESVLQALESWSAADDPDIRRDAMSMGLQRDFARFAPLALDAMLEGTVNADWMGWRFFEHGHELTTSDVAKIEKVIRDRKKSPNLRPLFEALSHCPLDAAADVLVGFARDEDTCLWWNALQYGRTKAVLGQFDSLPPEMKVRRLLVANLNTTVMKADAEILARAKAALPSLVTPQLCLCGDYDDFAGLVDAVATLCDREVALSAFAGFLRNVSDYERANGIIIRMIQHINLWKGTDFGGLGGNVEDMSRVNLGMNARRLSCDVLAWLDTGKAPAEMPDGYRPGRGDMRVVFLNTGNIEESAVALWPDQESPAVVGLPHRISTSSADFVFFIGAKMVYSNVAQARLPGYEFFCRHNFGMKDKYSNGYASAGGEFTRLVMPYRLELAPAWAAVIEAADSPESALKGTKVFADWWAVYGPQGRRDVALSSTDAVLTQDPPSR